MVSPPPAALLLLLLPLPLLRASAALPAPPRPERHSDGTFTSELSRLRDSARLQRLLQDLVGKRSSRTNSEWGDGVSEQDPETSTAPGPTSEGQLCLLWSHPAVLQAWVPLRTPLNPTGAQGGLPAGPGSLEPAPQASAGGRLA